MTTKPWMAAYSPCSGAISEGAGFDISITSLAEKATIKRGKTGDITWKAKMILTLRPGVRAGKPVKVTLSEKLVGRLE